MSKCENGGQQGLQPIQHPATKVKTDKNMKRQSSIVNRCQKPVSPILNVAGWALLFVLCGCDNKAGHSFQKAMKRYNAKDIPLQNEAGIFIYNHQRFTGTVYALLPNQKDTLAIGSFIDGKEDGEWRRYFTAVQLMEKRFYSAGIKVGVYEAWWPNGSRRLVYHFAGGEYEGTCKDWAENGILISEMTYHQGHEEGPQKQYYDNGKIKANYVMQNGRRYGLLGTKNCVNVSDSVFRKF